MGKYLSMILKILSQCMMRSRKRMLRDTTRAMYFQYLEVSKKEKVNRKKLGEIIMFIRSKSRQKKVTGFIGVLYI